MVFKIVYMQVKRLIILSACLFFANNSGGKKVPKYIREKFTNCYTGKNTGVRNLIEIDGYYELKRLFPSYSGDGEHQMYGDTLQHNIVFYEDGTFLYNFSEEAPSNGGVDWGIYSNKGDTIITQYLTDVALLAPWDGWEDKYIIVDQTTIMALPSESRPLYWQSRQARKATLAYMAERKFLPSRFKPSDKLPPPDSWLKKQSWTKCNGGQK